MRLVTSDDWIEGREGGQPRDALGEGARRGLEAMAGTLEESGLYRILRRLEPKAPMAPPVGDDLSLVIVLDTETTGLTLPGTEAAGATPSEVISLAMIALAYRPDDGEIVGPLGTFDRLRQPLFPIPAEAVRVHGIDDAMVEGHAFGNEDIAAWIAEMTSLCPEARCDDPLLVAANAGYDRPMLEAVFDVFTLLPWGCSQTQIPWRDHGLEGAKLSYLAQEAGFFYDRHDALSDCWAVTELLGKQLGASTALSLLLRKAREPTVRIFAENSPFEARAILKARGYRWHPGDAARRKAWFIDASEADRDLELDFLQGNVPLVVPRIELVDAWRRFSTRRHPA